jgi:hypothetical protein
MECNRVTLNALGPQHNSQWEAHPFKHRPLLDMKLQISGSISPFLGGVPYPFHLDLALPKSILQPSSIAISPAPISFNRLRPRKRRRSEETPSKTRTFFIGPIDQTYRNRRPAVKILRRAPQYFEARKNA